MNFSKEEIRHSMLLYAITDRTWLKEGETLTSICEDVLKHGATFLQIREKDLEPSAFQKEALELKALCAKYQVPFVVNDSVEIALAIDADGVHVGQGDIQGKNLRALIGKDKILGISAATVAEAVAAQAAGADYIGVGAVFGTSTKKNARNLSVEKLREICAAVTIPVVAIGGIHASNLRKLSGSQVDGVAVISEIFSSDNPGKATSDLLSLARQLVQPTPRLMRTALSIAGSDCSGGAGIQADLKTMTMNGVYAMSAITALTAQNTTKVEKIVETSPDFLKSQLDMIFTDIFPDAVKIGMLPNARLIEVLAERLRFYQAKHIVLDPVMVATSGSILMETSAVLTLKKELLPLAELVTPNIPEAEILSERKITTPEEIEAAAEFIGKTYRCAVLIKGGHSVNTANDLLWADGQMEWFYGRCIPNPNTHGTGCTLSSAIAANLDKGYSLSTSVQRAKKYLSGALSAMLDLGASSGPMNHAFCLTGEFS